MPNLQFWKAKATFSEYPHIQVFLQITADFLKNPEHLYYHYP